MMSEEVWRASLNLCYEYELEITLGGGEPTLHPQFERILLESIGLSNINKDRNVAVITNGSHRDRSLLLWRLGVQGIVYARLSYDQYHDLDMIDDEVIDKFTQNKMLWGTTTRNVVKAGRAIHIKGAEEGCICPTSRIEPNGDIFHCGCLDAPRYGNILTGFDCDEFYTNEYWKSPCYA